MTTDEMQHQRTIGGVGGRSCPACPGAVPGSLSGSGFFLGRLSLTTACRGKGCGVWLAADGRSHATILTRSVIELG